MRLHENKNLFTQAVRFTAQQMNLPEIYVEKDYWVTYALYTIFNAEIGSESVFKGGTSLLKCYQFIERFSEDIDLVVLRREGESNNKLTNKIKEISKIVSQVLPEVAIPEVTQKMGMNRKTAHTYPKEFDGNYNQVRDVIIVEATWLGYFEPYSIREISSFIYDRALKGNQDELAKEYNLLPFEAKILEPKRTMCEKIMSLVRFSYGENALDDLKKKIRHIYDLHQLLKDAELLSFFNSQEFDSLLIKVAQDDLISYKNSNAWLQHHPNKSMLFSNVEKIWDELKKIYNYDFKFLVFGELPDDVLILHTLLQIKNRLSKIDWIIKINS